MTNKSILALVAAVGCFAGEGERPPLMEVHRVYVEKLQGESAAQIRDMIINALQGTRIFVVTEDAQRADALLKGSAEDLVYNDQFQSNESVNASASLSGGSGISLRGGGSSNRRGSSGLSVGENEGIRIQERKHEAMAAVRLVAKNGDVIWSTTQESQGAKFRGASADVADKVVRQLLADVEKSRRGEVLP